MSSNYEELKRQRDRALIESIHGPLDGADQPSSSASPDFDGGATRGGPELPFMPAYLTDPQPVSPRQGDGWGPEYEIEDGAALLFPWLEDR